MVPLNWLAANFHIRNAIRMSGHTDFTGCILLMQILRMLIVILWRVQSAVWSPLNAAETLWLLPYLKCKHAQLQILGDQPLFQEIMTVDTRAVAQRWNTSIKWVLYNYKSVMASRDAKRLLLKQQCNYRNLDSAGISFQRCTRKQKWGFWRI